MKWMNDFAQLWTKPSAEVLAQEELEEAKRQLLAALSAQEYAKAMVGYHTERVKRLSKSVEVANEA